MGSILKPFPRRVPEINVPSFLYVSSLSSRGFGMFPNDWIFVVVGVIVVLLILAAVVWISFKTCLRVRSDDHQLISTEPALGNTAPTVNAQFNRPSPGVRLAHWFGDGENVEPGPLDLHCNDHSHHIHHLHHWEFNHDTHMDVTTSSFNLAESNSSYREIMECSSDTIIHSSEAEPCSAEKAHCDLSGDFVVLAYM